MDNLSRFYLDMATDANKLHAFNSDAKGRRAMLEQAGIEDIDKILSMDKESLRQTLAKALIEQTGDWQGLECNAANDDNKNNIDRIGHHLTH